MPIIRMKSEKIEVPDEYFEDLKWFLEYFLNHGVFPKAVMTTCNVFDTPKRKLFVEFSVREVER